MQLVLKCNLCNQDRKFKTLIGYNKGKNKICVSCSNSIKAGGSGNVKEKNGEKLCSKCEISQIVENFHRYSNGRLHSECNECKKQSFRTYQKERGRFYRHGITKEIYIKMFNKQNGKCYTCKKSFDVLSIDHEHSTGKIRKLLCNNCNSSLGLLKENFKTLENMISYLKEFQR